MKNLKRVLSMALASVMLVGTMVVGASAVDFTDGEDITHTEAVNVMSTLGVLKGKDTGAFDPNATVTRAEMAKIICVMLNGGVDPTLGSATTSMYSDVPATHWARPYIEYCTNIGVVAGQGNGTFGPDAPVTGAAAAKMLLVALGYDSDIHGFVGADWELNVNSKANAAKLYEEIKGIDTSKGLSRDDTAQMAYNTLDAFIMERTDNKVVSNGEISYTYEVSKTTTFLNRYFDAYTFIGTFEATGDTDEEITKGYMKVTGCLDTEDPDYNDGVYIDDAEFPYDFDVAYLGEEVKVIFKNGKSGDKTKPTKNDTIYGVFITGATEVEWATVNDIATGDNAATAGKVKIDGTTYTIADTATADDVITNYVATTGGTATVAAFKSGVEGLGKQTGDAIKILLKDGKIYRVYVVEYNLSKITAITSETISVSGVGALTIEDHDIEEGLKKGDVVVYTMFYNEDPDEATFSVKKAETIEGEITGYKTTTGGYASVTIDGEKYTVSGKTLKTNLTDDPLNTLSDNIGTEVCAYMVGGMVGALNKTGATETSWALVTGATEGGSADKKLGTGRIRLLLVDGTTVTYTVAESSANQPGDEINVGDFVKYSVTSDNTVKVSAVSDEVNSTVNVWNEDTKRVAGTAVAEADAVLYVTTEDDPGEAIGKDFEVYDIRTLSTLTLDAVDTVKYVTNDSGKIIMAFVDLKDVPAGATSSRIYGMITADNGVVKINGDECHQFAVWTGDGTIEINMTGSDSFTTGQYVTFKESVDGAYKDDVIDVIADAELVNKDGTISAAVKEYNSTDKTISVYRSLWEVTAENGTKTYEPVKENDKEVISTYAISDDCVIVGVNRNTKKGVANTTEIDEYDLNNGYANVKMIIDDEVVVAIFVETSGKVDINGDKDATARTTMNVTAKPAD